MYWRWHNKYISYEHVLGASPGNDGNDAKGKEVKSSKPISSRQLTDSEKLSGNEVRDIFVSRLPSASSVMNGLRFVSAFSDNSLILW